MADRDRENLLALRMVPDGRYADWEAIYRDNATWVYRTIFARGNQPDAEDSQPRYFWPLWAAADFGNHTRGACILRATARAPRWPRTGVPRGREITDRVTRRGPDSEGGNQHGPQRVRVLKRCRQLPPDPELRFLQGAQSRTRDGNGCQRGQRQGAASRAPQRAAKLTGTTSDDRARVAEAIYR
jgi:RNA polymerase sigma-70 factor (ECF subfamily)